MNGDEVPSPCIERLPEKPVERRETTIELFEVSPGMIWRDITSPTFRSMESTEAPVFRLPAPSADTPW